ncbi:LLM class flavin-dependent oxidoreductase [Caldimonas sp. KR1-144]|uniref:LLM class flavin-dependent oxidoreductase n=1 Tax=Caldimonas sp. KR1-144 TaxID=3400911 RepID=UPI003C09E2BB
MNPVALSVLDLSPIVEGGDAARALAHTLDLARHAEALGFGRYWLAEHHNMEGVASSATAVLIGHVAGGTSRMRVGSAGVMLPNHAPLVIAEQFGTLATLYPGRIDLGLGRAPGTDPVTMRALRRTLVQDDDSFIADVQELQSYLGPARPGQPVRAIPGVGTEVPVWILGSSLYGAQVAAMLGLPFAFASHFAPAMLLQALEIYRERFRPSATLARPYAAVGVNVIAADSDDEAARLFTSLQQRFLGMQRGQRGPLPRPVATMDGRWSEPERLGVERALAVSAVGSPATVVRRLRELLALTRADELIVTCAVHDHDARKRSYALLAEARPALTVDETALS